VLSFSDYGRDHRFCGFPADVAELPGRNPQEVGQAVTLRPGLQISPLHRAGYEIDFVHGRRGEHSGRGLARP